MSNPVPSHTTIRPKTRRAIHALRASGVRRKRTSLSRRCVRCAWTLMADVMISGMSVVRAVIFDSLIATGCQSILRSGKWMDESIVIRLVGACQRYVWHRRRVVWKLLHLLRVAFAIAWRERLDALAMTMGPCRLSP